MNIVGVIPARYGSTRFPGKPLKTIAEKPLLQWVIEGAQESQKIKKIIVATDHIEIKALAESLGVEAIMTDSELPSGSDRVWQAVKNENFEYIINIQGDEPLIHGPLLDSLIGAFESDSNVQMSTLGRKFQDKEALLSKNTAKIVLNKCDEAIYFSRSVIPHSRSVPEINEFVCLKHIGIYAYQKDFLKEFCETGPVDIELCEGLEQLRAIYLGAKIKVVQTDYDSWGVDTPEDILNIEKKLKDLGRI